MAEKTPVERAARALGSEYSDAALCNHAFVDVRAALTSAVEDREGLARLLIRHDSDRMTCFNHDGECCPAEDAHDFESRQGHQADAVARWLTGEEA